MPPKRGVRRRIALDNWESALDDAATEEWPEVIVSSLDVTTVYLENFLNARVKSHDGRVLPVPSRQSIQYLTAAAQRLGLVVSQDGQSVGAKRAATKKAKRGNCPEITRAGLSINTVFDGVDDKDGIVDAIRRASSATRCIALHGSLRVDLLMRHAIKDVDALREWFHANTNAEVDKKVKTFVTKAWYASKINETTNKAIPHSLSDEEELQCFGNAKFVWPARLESNVFKEAANAYARALILHFTDLTRVKRRIIKFVQCHLWDAAFKLKKPRRISRASQATRDAWRDFQDGGAAAVKEGAIKLILTAIETGDDMHVVRDEHRAALKAVRGALGIGVGVELDEPWLTFNMVNSVKFSMCTLRAIDDISARRKDLAQQLVERRCPKEEAMAVTWAPESFTFVPHCRSSDERRFVTIGETVLRAGQMFPGRAQERVELADAMIERIELNLRKALGRDYHPDGKFRWTRAIDSDGYSCNVHFYKRKAPSSTPPKPASSKRKADEELPRVALPDIIVSVDPGRVNLATAVVRVAGQLVMRRVGRCGSRMKPLSMKLTARQHRMETGATRHGAMQRANLKAEQLRHKELHADLDKSTYRTSDISKIQAYASLITELAALRSCSRAATSRRRSLKCKRTSSMQRFFVRLRRAAEKAWSTGRQCVTTPTAYLVWGNGSFGHTGLGHSPGPTKTLRHVAIQVFKLDRGEWESSPKWIVEDGCEFRTSALSCFPSHGKSLAVRVQGVGKKVVGRRMRFMYVNDASTVGARTCIWVCIMNWYGCRCPMHFH
jgi:hypothetical protein